MRVFFRVNFNRSLMKAFIAFLLTFALYKQTVGKVHSFNHLISEVIAGK